MPNNKPNHTPGPWTTYYTYVGIKDSNTGLVAKAIELKGKGIKHDNELREQALANAQLIAAAPDMLEALERALPWLNKMVADGSHANTALPKDAITTLDLVRKAIAKGKKPIKKPW